MLAPTTLTLAGWYLGIGVATAISFGALVQRIEPSARGATPLFRLLILPGATLLWPVIWLRCARSFQGRAR
jgi:hypothetical protein